MGRWSAEPEEPEAGLFDNRQYGMYVGLEAWTLVTTRPPVYNVGFDYLARGLRLGLGLGYTVHIADGPVTGVHNDFNATESGVRTDSGVQPNLCKLFTIIEVYAQYIYTTVWMGRISTEM